MEWMILNRFKKRKHSRRFIEGNLNEKILINEFDWDFGQKRFIWYLDSKLYCDASFLDAMDRKSLQWIETVYGESKKFALNRKSFAINRERCVQFQLNGPEFEC